MPSISQRTCKQCGGSYSTVFFRTKNSWSKHVVCIGCELTGRTTEKQRNRPLKKAQSAVKTHAPKLIKRGVIVSEQELIMRYGWNAIEMAHDIEHAFKNGCPYCCEKFATMPHGLGDVTLDIVDTDRPPFYKTNVKWVCITCNRAKSRTSPDVWSEKLAMWAEWRRIREAKLIDPWYGTLFAGQDVQGQQSFI